MGRGVSRQLGQGSEPGSGGFDDVAGLDDVEDVEDLLFDVFGWSDMTLNEAVLWVQLKTFGDGWRRCDALDFELTGARTEELRPLTWSHVDLEAHPPFIMVWRSVRAGGETKTKKSRRTLALPQRCVEVLREHREQQQLIREQAGGKWQDNDLVFPSRAGTPADASHIRRSFRKVTEAAGLNPADWTPRELRHSFVSLLSDAGVPIEQISRLVGHSGTTTTETVYRKQIRPVITEGAEVMDRLFPSAGEKAPDA